MIRFLMWLFLRRPPSLYEFGFLSDIDHHGPRARRHKITGKIEILLWPRGHRRSPDYDFWAEVGSGHTFMPDDAQATL